MLTDYKFWYIKRDDNGFITEVAVRFYEGDITTEAEYDSVLKQTKAVTRYRRMRRLPKSELPHLKRNQNFVLEASGKEAKIYDQSDFGGIKTDDELRNFLNTELVKDTKRSSINEQKLAT